MIDRGVPLHIAATRRFETLARSLYRHVAAVTWPAVGLIAASHFLSSWLLMAVTDGAPIALAQTFWYYYFVTATTVGYGDFAPVTSAGRAVAVFWIMPGGIAIFTSVIAKVVQSAAAYWRRRMLGLDDFSDLEAHTVILGWNGENTRKMVAFMRGDQAERDIVLVSYKVQENPMPDEVHFVRGDSLTADDVLQRSGVPKASRAVVVGQDDNETLAACLAVAARNHDLHLVAFFSDEAVAGLLKAHLPKAECIVPMQTEMLVRTADDPGSSRISNLLFSTLVGPTLFSMKVPAGAPRMYFGSVFLALRRDWQVNLLGIAWGPGADELYLNPPDDRVVHPGETIYYIGEERVHPEVIDWSALGQD